MVLGEHSESAGLMFVESGQYKRRRRGAGSASDLICRLSLLVILWAFVGTSTSAGPQENRKVADILNSGSCIACALRRDHAFIQRSINNTGRRRYDNTAIEMRDCV